MEAHIKKVIEGGELHGYGGKGKIVEFGARCVSPIEGGAEDRNRTAPIPFCGNRFEFRAVGSSQNISFPMAILNTVMAESMGELAASIEGGLSQKEAVAKMFKENLRALFNGNGYSEEWPVEAEKRGLPNLKNTVEALKTLNSAKNQKLFSSQNVYSEAELEATTETLFESYNNTITIEVDTLTDMVDTGVLPACAKDLKTYEGSNFGKERAELYAEVAKENEKLKTLRAATPEETEEVADYCVGVLKPQMEVVREKTDAAEKLVEHALWPFPKYAEVLYGMHFDGSY